MHKALCNDTEANNKHSHTPRKPITLGAPSSNSACAERRCHPPPGRMSITTAPQVHIEEVSISVRSEPRQRRFTQTPRLCDANTGREPTQARELEADVKIWAVSSKPPGLGKVLAASSLSASTQSRPKTQQRARNSGTRALPGISNVSGAGKSAARILPLHGKDVGRCISLHTLQEIHSCSHQSFLTQDVHSFLRIPSHSGRLLATCCCPSPLLCLSSGWDLQKSCQFQNCIQNTSTGSTSSPIPSKLLPNDIKESPRRDFPQPPTKVRMWPRLWGWRNDHHDRAFLG